MWVRLPESELAGVRKRRAQKSLKLFVIVWGMLSIVSSVVPTWRELSFEYVVPFSEFISRLCLALAVGILVALTFCVCWRYFDRFVKPSTLVCSRCGLVKANDNTKKC